MRLGSGQFGSDNDYNALKNHPYFKNVDFDKVFLMQTPYNFKKFQRSTLRQQLLDQKNADESNDILMTTSGNEEESHSEINQIQQKLKANVIISAVLKKKNSLGLFYKRVVTLTDEPKLFYLKTTKDKATSVPKQI